MVHLDGFLETLEGAHIDGLVVIDATHTIVLFSRGAEHLFGYSRDEVEGLPLSLLLPQRFQAPHESHLDRFAVGPDSARDAGAKRLVVGRRKSGEEFELDASIYRYGPSNAPTMAALVREAAPSAHASVEAMQQLAVIAEAGIGFFSHNHATAAVFCSEALANLLAIPQGALRYEDLAAMLAPSENAWFLEALNGSSSKGEERSSEQEYLFLHAQGARRCIAVRSRTRAADQGGVQSPRQTVGVVRDVTRRRAREDQQRFLLALADAMRREGRPEAVLQTACRMLCEHLDADRVIYTDIDGDDFTTRACHQRGVIAFPTHGKIADFGAAFLGPYLEGEVVGVSDVETDERVTQAEREHFRRAGIAAFAGVMLLKDGACLGALGAHRHATHTWTLQERGLLREVVERVWGATATLRAQNALARNEARMRAAFESSSAGLCEIGPDIDAIVRCNAAFAEMFEADAHALVGQSFSDLMHPSDRAEIEQEYARLQRAEISELRIEKRFVRTNGKSFVAELTANLARDGEGAPLLIVTIMRDVTEAVRTRQDLAQTLVTLEARVAERTRALEDAMARREEAIEALAQAQRLEAIGRLTGGVVHDGNNMLTLIAGNLEMMEDLQPTDQMLRHLREAQSAVEKMRQLNRRLLTFARKRRLEPIHLDLNVQIAAMSDMLARVLGSGVSLSMSLADAPCSVLADPVEVDNAILNLAINARDAMPKGGALHIATEILEPADGAAACAQGAAPGRSCRVTITDTGEGIAKDVLPHVFEPFFTTKASGVGTGLGLATVYGFMKQSGGHVEITSTPARGTTVTLYFPFVEGSRALLALSDPVALSPGGGELVLVVEDEPNVRRLTAERLQRLGYATQEAADGLAALAALSKHDGVALVFSDVVLPGGMSGFDLAERIAQQWPETKVLLTSGFDMGVQQTGDAALRRWRILPKPYAQSALARALRATLGA